MPEFTVVIPARNEAKYLPMTLRALERQTLPPREVIVVDNGSRDATLEIARAAGARVLSCEARGVAHARQLGLESARTEWVATTDADSLPVPHWLEALSEAAPGRTALYGPMRFSGVARHWALASGSSYSAFLHVARVIGRPNLAGANMAFSREAALLVGGYPPVEAYEDVILGEELARIGEIAYVRRALVETSARRLDRGVLPFVWQHFKNITGHTRGYFGDDR
ncbi:glycosyltransferase [Deinococcus radiotolerans]|uniref:Glycosyl transferase n=1 Tax=Deinococcus radiotolerans TaxID=1309407 RepID=A0ABQ2FMN4_9DEIO|nr:glycosyltransferase family A protein [Deinococcus radiotolerans]GGL05227.1 glycosyl transferase [Deinococcus radiotolerans]